MPPELGIESAQNTFVFLVHTGLTTLPVVAQIGERQLRRQERWQTRGQGNADVNSRASNGGSGTQGVSGGTRGVGSLSPIYPPICRRRGEEGKVMLQWQVLASGRCGWVKVVQSSGYELLDQAAVEAVKNADFHPATRFGQAVDDVKNCSFRFNLTDAG